MFINIVIMKLSIIKELSINKVKSINLKTYRTKVKLAND